MKKDCYKISVAIEIREVYTRSLKVSAKNEEEAREKVLRRFHNLLEKERIATISPSWVTSARKL